MFKSPSYLYKYRSFGDKLLKDLVYQTAYFCSPSNFNDPFDVLPLVSNDLSTQELEKLAYQILLKNSGGKRTEEDFTHARRVINNYRYEATQFGSHDDNSVGEREYVRSLLNVVERDFANIFKSIGILCLATHWNSVLMWSHYAGNHAGVCLEYRFDGNLCENLKSVVYGGTRSVLTSELRSLQFGNDPSIESELRERVLFSKARHWRYEREWRAIKSPPGSHSSPFILNAIYFGARCDSSIKMTILKLFVDSDVQPNFYSVYLDNSHSKLKCLRLDDSEVGESRIQEPVDFMARRFFKPIEEDLKGDLL